MKKLYDEVVQRFPEAEAYIAEGNEVAVHTWRARYDARQPGHVDS